MENVARSGFYARFLLKRVQYKRKCAGKVDRVIFSTEGKSAFKLVFHLANFFARTSKKRMRLAGDDVSVCRQPIKLLFSLFARTNSPRGKPALVNGTIERHFFIYFEQRSTSSCSFGIDMKVGRIRTLKSWNSCTVFNKKIMALGQGNIKNIVQ